MTARPPHTCDRFVGFDLSIAPKSISQPRGPRGSDFLAMMGPRYDAGTIPHRGDHANTRAQRWAARRGGLPFPSPGPIPAPTLEALRNDARLVLLAAAGTSGRYAMLHALWSRAVDQHDLIELGTAHDLDVLVLAGLVDAFPRGPFSLSKRGREVTAAIRGLSL